MMDTPPPQDPPVNTPPPQPGPDPNYIPTAGPSIRFDVIGQAFSMVFADAGTWIVSAIVIIVAVMAVNIVLNIVMLAMLAAGGGFIALAFRMVTLGLTIAMEYVLIANMFRMAITAISGGKPTVNDLFKFGPQTGNILVAGLVVGFGTGLLMPCCLIGLVFGGLTMFTLPLVVDRNLPAMEAISKSIDMLKKDWLMATLFFLVVSICSWILFGLTIGVMPIALALLYRDYFGFASATPDVA
jgi:uncharacterized membrane protein